MGITIRDRKLLWARSGNECAYPGCDQQLVLNTGDSDVIVGEEAHICSRRPFGPRGTGGLTSAQLDSYQNLILLCPTHHTIVDGAQESFLLRTLTDMKLHHESAIRERKEGRIRAERVNLDVIDYGDLANAWQVGRSTLLACSYGSPPVESFNERWLGSGIRFLLAGPDRDPKLLLDSSEALPDIEYWVQGSELHVVRSTYLYDESCFAPFAEEIFEAKEDPAVRTVISLLNGAPSLVPKVRALVNDFLESPTNDRSTKFLGAIFRAGISSPRAVLREIPRIAEAPCFCGGEAQTVRIMKEELELLRIAATA